MMIDEKFLLEVAKQKKYTFISTGMCNYKIIDKAVEIFRSQNCEFELMHCTSAYPFENKYAQLRLIHTLRDRYKCNIFYIQLKTNKEIQICKKLEPSLKQNGFFFVGIDVIDEKLTEINVTSPTGIKQINQLSGLRIEEKFWDEVLKIIS